MAFVGEIVALVCSTALLSAVVEVLLAGRRGETMVCRMLALGAMEAVFSGITSLIR